MRRQHAEGEQHPSAQGNQRSAGVVSTATRSTAGNQTITVTQYTGLMNGQTVHVVAAGFSPNETLGVIECVDKGNATGEGDCDISALKSVTSDAHGRVVADFTVIVELMVRLRAERDITIVMVTHAIDVAAAADRVIEMSDGAVVAG